MLHALESFGDFNINFKNIDLGSHQSFANTIIKTSPCLTCWYHVRPIQGYGIKDNCVWLFQTLPHDIQINGAQYQDLNISLWNMVITRWHYQDHSQIDMCDYLNENIVYHCVYFEIYC